MNYMELLIQMEDSIRTSFEERVTIIGPYLELINDEFSQ